MAARTAEDLTILITLPTTEQYKVPVWSDVKMLMKIQWTSSELDLPINHDTFQHYLYTIKYAPATTYLIAMIEPNYNYVQKGQTLIMSSNETTVSGLHPSQVKDMLSYKWVCPVGLQPLCEGQTGPNLYVPWNRIGQVALNFSQIYEFSAEITWHKPDGTNETRIATNDVQWYNLQKPVFKIDNLEDQVLTTSTSPTTFTIEGLNFDSFGDMSIYKIDWEIEPRLQNQFATKSINYGQKL